MSGPAYLAHIIHQIMDEEKRSWSISEIVGHDWREFLVQVLTPLRQLRDQGCIKELREIKLGDHVTQALVIGPIAVENCY